MILVTGAGGFVGSTLLTSCDQTLACPSLKGLSEDEIRRIVEESQADTIVHTAAISDVRACEKDPDASYEANVLLSVSLAKAAQGRKLICFSSDQVYTGSREEGPYSEDMACPANVYAAHKLEMEQRVLDVAPTAVLLRAQWMYGYYLKKSNFFMNMLRATHTVTASSRQYRGLTYVKEVAQQLDAVCRLPGGVYNFGSESKQSMYQLTEEFLRLIGKQVTVEDVAPAHNLWTNCHKAKKHGVRFRFVEDGLKQCAEDYGLLTPAPEKSPCQESRREE